MKKLNPFTTMTLFLIAMSILISCSSSKTAINCPTLPRSNSNPKASSHLKKLDKKVFAYSRRKSIKTRNTRNYYAQAKRNNSSPAPSVSNFDTITNRPTDSYYETLRIPARVDYNESLLASIDDSALPVELVLPITEAMINSTTDTNLNPTNGIGKKEDTSIPVNNSIKMSSENINSHPNLYLTNSLSQDSPPKVAGLARAGFILSLVFFLMAFPQGLGLIPLGLIPIIFGAISLKRIKRNPTKFKGKGFAIVSLVLGIIDLVLGVILTLSYIGD